MHFPLHGHIVDSKNEAKRKDPSHAECEDDDLRWTEIDGSVAFMMIVLYAGICFGMFAVGAAPSMWDSILGFSQSLRLRQTGVAISGFIENFREYPVVLIG